MKNKIIGTLLISGMMLGMASTASAATTTKGRVDFETGNTDGDTEVIKPKEDPEEPDEIIEPENPIIPEVVKDVVLKYVPTFDFGSNQISKDAKSYSAKYDQMKSSGSTGTYKAPHFAQVHDRSGSLDTVWNLSVSQADDFTHTNTTSILNNATIDLYGATATTNNGVTTADALTSLSIASGSKTSIPKKADGSLELMKSKAAGTTNGVHSSIVFENGYQEANYDATKSAALPERTDSVKLNVPQQSGILKGTYTTNLEWNLSVTP